MKELPKAYKALIEKETYKKWRETGLFNLYIKVLTFESFR
jgi:hypothetical protein